jgi:hypothetical protein
MVLMGSRSSFDGSDDSEGGFAAAQAPEEVRMLGGSHVACLTVAGHDVQGADVVRGQAEGGNERAYAAAAEVSGDPDASGGSDQWCEPVGCRCLKQLTRHDASADASGPPGRVDGAFVQAAGVNEQDIIVQRNRAVPRGLHRYAQAAGGSEADCRCDVISIPGGYDSGWGHRNRPVPRLRQLIARLARHGQRAGQPVTQAHQRGGELLIVTCLGGHGSSSPSWVSTLTEHLRSLLEHSNI